MKLQSFDSWLINKKAVNVSEVSNDGNDMITNNLNDIIEYATKLLSVVDESSELDEWMESKITIARTYMSDVTHAYLNDLKKQQGGCSMSGGGIAGYLGYDDGGEDMGTSEFEM